MLEKNVLQLLLDIGVLERDDVERLLTSHTDALLEVLVGNHALRPVEIDDVRVIITELLRSSSKKKYLKARRSLVRIITANINRQMGWTGDKLRIQKERITGNSWPAITPTILEDAQQKVAKRGRPR